MKKVLAVVLVLILSLGLVACGSDPAADEFSTYLNGTRIPIKMLYNEAVNAVNDASASGDADAYLSSLNDVALVKLDDALTQAKALTFTSEEVKAINDLYITAIEARKAQYQALAKVAENPDGADTTSLQNLLAAADAAMTVFTDACNAFAAEHHLTIS